MGYEEYYDLYLKAQENNAKYRMFCFDVKDHLKLSEDTLYFKDLEKLTDNVTKDILLLEKKLKKKIFDRDYNTIFIKKQENKATLSTSPLKFLMFNPNYMQGDLIYFCVYNGSISEEDFLKIFAKNYKKLNLNYVFHYATGLYETNNYIEGKNKYYKGYCFHQLNEIAHKNEIKLFDKKEKNRKITKSR